MIYTRRPALFILIMTEAVILSVGTSVAQEVKARYKVGQSREFRVSVPKPGYIGAPPGVHSYPDIRKPTKRSHFRAFHVRVSVTKIRNYKGATRVVMRVDQAAENGDARKGDLHYFFYVDPLKEGTRVVFRLKDDDGQIDEKDSYGGLPFPFACSPPSMGYVREGYVRGYVDHSIGWGSTWKVRKDGRTGAVTVHASRTDSIRKSDTEYSKKVEWSQSRILYTETQKWASSDSWLWTSMERRDAKGNVQMQCKTVKEKKQ